MRSDNLPAVTDDVIEGEIVDDLPSTRGSVVVILKPVIYVLDTVRVVSRHEHTRQAGRHVSYVGLGAGVVAKRVWDSRTTARYDRFIRAAEATGDHQTALEWDERRAVFLKERHSRRMDLLALPGKILVKAPKVVAGGVAVLAGIGAMMAVATKHIAEVAMPFLVSAHIVEWSVIVMSVTWAPVLLTALCLTPVVLWHVGRRATVTSGPGWLQTSAEYDGIVIDERSVARALGDLGFKGITSYIKQGLPMQFIVPCRIEGRGTGCVIRLPNGVTAEQVARRRPNLAASLHRQAKEVWPGTGDEAGILKLWIADKGALEEGAGPYPLLADGLTDVFKGLPIGRTLKGDPVRLPVIGRNSICGGAPEQGKSNSARNVAVGYALDLVAELRIYVPDTNYDFECFKPRCARYVMGAEDVHIGRIRDELAELKAEIQKRGQLLIDHGEQEVTRELAHAGIGLHPVFVLLEEAHVAIQHPVYGKEISQLLIDIVKLDRKRGIHLMVSTQSPTKDSMPRDVTRNCTLGIAHAVGDHVANDALLGQGAYAAGHRATELIPGTDRGTALVKGFSGERSEMVQVHRLPVGKGEDLVSPLIARAMAELARLGREVPGTGQHLAIESRDLLDDLNELIGTDPEPVRLADLPPMLRKLAPTWSQYQSLNGVQLRDLLDAEDVRTTNTGNVPRLDPVDLRHAISARALS